MSHKKTNLNARLIIPTQIFSSPDDDITQFGKQMTY